MFDLFTCPTLSRLAAHCALLLLVVQLSPARVQLHSALTISNLELLHCNFLSAPPFQSHDQASLVHELSCLCATSAPAPSQYLAAADLALAHIPAGRWHSPQSLHSISIQPKYQPLHWASCSRRSHIFQLHAIVIDTCTARLCQSELNRVRAMVRVADQDILSHEEKRLKEDTDRTKYWKKWGPYVAERQWGTGPHAPYISARRGS